MVEPLFEKIMYANIYKLEGVIMIIVKVIRYDKNGNVKEYKMKFKGTQEELLEIEKLADMAEDCYADQLESWR